jgi:hypothetical protein
LYDNYYLMSISNTICYTLDDVQGAGTTGGMPLPSPALSCAPLDTLIGARLSAPLALARGVGRYGDSLLPPHQGGEAREGVRL